MFDKPTMLHFLIIKDIYSLKFYVIICPIIDLKKEIKLSSL